MAQRRVEAKRAKYLAMSKRIHEDPSFSESKLTVYSFLRASAMSTPKQNAGDVVGTPGEEAPRDPGALADRAAIIANNADLDNGHRVFHGYGFHMPTTAYRRRGHRRHHKHHRITNGHNKGNKSSRDEDDDDDEEEEMLPQNLRPCKWSFSQRVSISPILLSVSQLIAFTLSSVKKRTWMDTSLIRCLAS